MNKAEFLKELDRLLSALPKDERQRSVEFYSEMIDDRIEDGASEENAVSDIGSPQRIAEEIIGDTVQPNAVLKRSVSPWTIVFAALASPIWLPILVSIIAVIVSVYISVWAIIISIGAVGLGIAAGAVGSVAAASAMLFTQPVVDAAFIFGCALILAGIAVFVILAFIYVVKAAIKATVWLIGTARTAIACRGGAKA